ncbi:MAG: PP2C family protein-serine/threonine phosphatase [Campylobacterota bacterium]
MDTQLQELVRYTKGLSLLFVEDDAQTAEAMQDLLENFFTVIHYAPNGAKAWDIYQNSEIDLVFTDINMPVMNGIELIKKIRSVSPQLPVMVFSAYSDNNYLLEAIKLGVDGYIVKPVDLDQFMQALHKIVRKYRIEQKERETARLYKRIGESIDFASLIQRSLLPSQQRMREGFADAFAIWEPRDGVGGDFYFFNRLKKQRYIVMMIDCTGHGVHGAFLTMIVEMLYRQMLAKIKDKPFDKLSPARLLHKLNKQLRTIMHKEVDQPLEGKGFDGQVALICKQEQIIKFAGAKNPLFYTHHNSIQRLDADNHSVGYGIHDKAFACTDKTLDYDPGTNLYFVTDGFWEQIGGKKGLPFGKKRFETMLQTHCYKSMSEQKRLFLETFNAYRKEADMPVVDDMAFIGLKL